MNKKLRINEVVVGALFVTTMLVGVLEVYYVEPKIGINVSSFYHIENSILIGVLSIIILALGVLGIAIALFPIIKKYNETIAVTYLSFRAVECVLLLLGAIFYLFLLSISKSNVESNFLSGALDHDLLAILLKMKLYSYQIAMITLGLGSMLLCYLFYKTEILPRWLSAWGFVGYLFLFLSAVSDLLGVIDTAKGAGALMYIPGGLWEFFGFPLWLFFKGFSDRQE